MARGWTPCNEHRRYDSSCKDCKAQNKSRIKNASQAKEFPYGAEIKVPGIKNIALGNLCSVMPAAMAEPIDRLGDACIAFNNELASVIMDVAIEQMGRADQLQHAAAILRGECNG